MHQSILSNWKRFRKAVRLLETHQIHTFVFTIITKSKRTHSYINFILLFFTHSQTHYISYSVCAQHVLPKSEHDCHMINYAFAVFIYDEQWTSIFILEEKQRRRQRHTGKKCILPIAIIGATIFYCGSLVVLLDVIPSSVVVVPNPLFAQIVSVFRSLLLLPKKTTSIMPTKRWASKWQCDEKSNDALSILAVEIRFSCV